MTSRRLLVLLLSLALVAVAGPAGAVGPLDGSYQITVTGEDVEPISLFLVVLQNDKQFGMALLDPTFPFWFYGFGTLDDQNHVTGPIIDPFDGTEYGQFNLRFEGTTVTGTISQFDVPFNVSGSKFF